MTLLRLQQARLEFPDQVILDNANLSIETNERICLIGRNGAGKTTLLKILLGEQDIDRGELHVAQDLRISALAQTLPEAQDALVREVVQHGLKAQRGRIEAYQALSAQPPSTAVLRQMERLQAQIESGGGWNIDQQVESTLSQLGLDGSHSLRQLSGGWRRRVALAKALVSKPDLLLLDEPTNHLDINTIEWLEQRLLSYEGSIVLITHDRHFLQDLATRIVEIDRGRLLSWPGNFQTYLRLKEQADADEDRHNALFDKRLAQEEAWIRQGIKARRTRNEGRVRALQAMREQRAARVKRQGKARLQVAEAEQSGRKVIEARKISHAYDDQVLIKDFSLRVMRGDRIGIIGNNGVGKSTLLSILLGELQPDQGSVKVGSGIELAYFDQLRRELDKSQLMADFVADGKDYVNISGKQRHIVSYLQQFLFSPKRTRTRISALSGGECNRVLLAKLFLQPSNVLVLDEPSNDLDVEMLEALEQRLVDYQGTLLLVSHDRQLLDNVVTSTLVFEQDGQVREYVGGYSDWLATQHRLAVSEQEATPSDVKALNTEVARPAIENTQHGLSFTEQHEWAALPDKISALEQQLEQQQEAANAPEFYQQSAEEVKLQLTLLEDMQAELDRLTNRWYDLEERNLR